MGIRWHELRPSLHFKEVALFLGRCSRYSKGYVTYLRLFVLHYVHVRARCMRPIHAWRAYTDKLRGDSRHAGTSCGVLPGSTADGHSCESCRPFASQSNSQLGPLREFRTLAEVKFRFLAFGSSMVWVGPSMTHLLWCHMSYFTSSSSFSSTDFPRGQDTCSAGPRMQRG